MSLDRIDSEIGGALFSMDRVYRYELWRDLWRINGGSNANGEVCFVMLNPSTACEFENDPTVERCQRRATQWGFSRMRVLNIFALRSTDPKLLYSHSNPQGPDNDDRIEYAAKRAKLVVCAWGTHGKFHSRGVYVLALLRLAGVKPHALRVNNDGTPAHPLYLPYTLKPEPME